MIDLFGIRLNVPVPIIVAILSVIIGGSLIRYWLYQGQWSPFVSEQYGYALEYPANFDMYVYGDGGYKGSIYIRSRFGSIWAPLDVIVYEKPMDKPDLEQVSVWGEEIINRHRGYNRSTLEEVEIGQGNYPALVRTYTKKIYFGRNLKIKVVYLATAKRAFALNFTVYEWNYSDQLVVIEHMLELL
ncbi:MAG: hypothetical protein IPL78_07080 [Chloroflexi bacterium]|nr:hypothetical protein [Chloroflexota bacterium]